MTSRDRGAVAQVWYNLDDPTPTFTIEQVVEYRVVEGVYRIEAANYVTHIFPLGRILRIKISHPHAE